MPIKQSDLITSHFKKPNSGNGTRYYNDRASTPVTHTTTKSSKTNIASVIIMGGEDTAEETKEKKYDANDIITAFMYGFGITLIFVITMLYSMNN